LLSLFVAQTKLPSGRFQRMYLKEAQTTSLTRSQKSLRFSRNSLLNKSPP
jgi:hypothetical protein